MSQCSGFNTSVEGFVEQHDGSASVFNKSSVLGVNSNEHVDKHPVQPHVHLDACAYYVRVKKRSPDVHHNDQPAFASGDGSHGKTEVVDAVGEDRTRSSYSSLSR